MPRSPKKIHEEKVLLVKAQLVRIDEARKEALRKSRKTLLAAHEAGMTQTNLARLWKTNPTRMKEMLAQAMAEKEGE